MIEILRPKNGMLYYAPLGTVIPNDFDPMQDWEFVRIQENGKPLYKTPSGKLFEPAGHVSDDEGIDFTREEVVEPEVKFDLKNPLNIPENCTWIYRKIA